MAKAWKVLVHDALIKVLVNTPALIELAPVVAREGDTQVANVNWPWLAMASRYVPDIKIRHVLIDLPRQPWQLSC